MKAKGALKNSIVALGTNAMLVPLGFLVQRVMARSLGKANLGMNSVFTSILSFMSLAELGLSSAIIYNLYAPLLNDDKPAIASLMRFYRWAYRVIAVGVLGVGLLLMPFVDRFLGGNEFPLGYVRGVFLLFVLRASLDYLLSYRRALVTAAQKTYIFSLANFFGQALGVGLGILAMRLSGSLAWYVAAVTVSSVAGNLALYIVAGRMFPYAFAKDSAPLDADTRKGVLKNVGNIFVMRVSGLILTATDNVIISSFLGVVVAAVYDNYAKLVAALTMLVTAVSSAVQPTLGALFAEHDMDKLRGVLERYTFLFYLVASFGGAGLLCLMRPFVLEVWLGGGYGLEMGALALCALNFFLITLRTPVWSMLNVSGLFARDKNISILGASSNLIVSLALVGPLGITGVLIGTFVSQGAQYILKVRLLYKRALGGGGWRYGRDTAIYFALFAAICALCYGLCGLIGNFWLKFALCLILPNAVNLAVFGRSARLRETVALLRGMTGK